MLALLLVLFRSDTELRPPRLALTVCELPGIELDWTCILVQIARLGLQIDSTFADMSHYIANTEQYRAALGILSA